MIKYKTQVTFEGFKWDEYERLVPYSSKINSNWLDDDAYVHFISTFRKARNLLEGEKQIEEAREVVLEFCNKYGTLWAVPRIDDIPLRQHHFMSLKEFMQQGERMENLLIDYEDDLVEEVQRNIEGSYPMQFEMKAERIDGKLEFIMTAQHLVQALFYQFAQSLGSTKKLQICNWCGNPFSKKRGAKFCKDSCRVRFSQEKSKGRK